MAWIVPVRLKGPHATLVPLQRNHRDALVAAASDGTLWRHWFTGVPEPDEMEAAIAERLALRDAGSMLPFTVVQSGSERIVGMTSFGHIDAVVKRVEIGWTWYAQGVQRTALNTDAKRLLLTHAFETLGCVAVELRTHVLNQPSRRAIERIGAKLDGVLRNHMVARNGTLRDTCVYSVIAGEWPAVQAHLKWLQEGRGMKEQNV